MDPVTPITPLTEAVHEAATGPWVADESDPDRAPTYRALSDFPGDTLDERLGNALEWASTHQAPPLTGPPSGDWTPMTHGPFEGLHIVQSDTSFHVYNSELSNAPVWKRYWWQFRAYFDEIGDWWTERPRF